MVFPKWLFFSAAVNGVRVAEKRASVDTQDAGTSALATSGNVGRVDGKVIKCIVGGVVVFEQDEDTSTFSTSLEYAENETGTTAWVVTIPGIFQIMVDSESMMAAQLGDWFAPKSYTTFPIDVEPAGKIMQESLTDTSNWVERVRIIRGSADTTVKIIAERRYKKNGKANVEIEFTGGPGPVEARVDLPVLGYYLPMQGDILRVKLDGRTVFDKANSELKFPVVCTPAFFNIPGLTTSPARGLSVNFVGFTYFWVRKREMEESGNFTPISLGYSTPTNDPTSLEMLAGFQRWQYAATRLTMRSNKYTVEISGNGMEVVFSKNKVEGKLTKCIAADGSIVFDKAEKDSAISAILSYAYNPTYISGWAINITGVVQIIMKEPISVASDTENLENIFRTTLQTCHTSNSTAPLDPSGEALRGVFCSGAIENVFVIYDSHQTIKIAAHRWNKGEIVHVEFSRGPGAAMADNYVTA